VSLVRYVWEFATAATFTNDGSNDAKYFNEIAFQKQKKCCPELTVYFLYTGSTVLTMQSILMKLLFKNKKNAARN